MEELTRDNPKSTGSRRDGGWIPDGEGVCRNGDLAIRLADGRYIVENSDGPVLSGELPCEQDSQQYGFHAILDEKLVSNDLPRASGLEGWCDWAECQVVEPQPAFDVKAMMEEAFATTRAARAKVRDAEVAVEEMQAKVPLGSFAERVTERRTDLVAVIENGIPPVEFLPESEGMLVRGARHYVPAPMKSGKSIATLSHAECMVAAGARVAILDRENGVHVYARRLGLIMDVRHRNPDEREGVRARLDYYAFPTLRREDADALVAELAESDLVVFDSQRTFLTNLGLGEDSSDDYSEFMQYVVDPLQQAGTATLILDNTGHKKQDRGRGSSSKGDLNEVLFTLKKTRPFDHEKTGEVRLAVAESRHGTGGAWTMSIGGGVFDPWVSASEGRERPRGAMLEEVSRAVEENPDIGKGTLLDLVTGNKAKKDTAVACLRDEGYIQITVGESGHQHRSIKRFRCSS
jgi:hypothetical protein